MENTVEIQWVNSGMKQMVRLGSHHRIDSGKYSGNTVENTIGLTVASG